MTNEPRKHGTAVTLPQSVWDDIPEADMINLIVRSVKSCLTHASNASESGIDWTSLSLSVDIDEITNGDGTVVDRHLWVRAYCYDEGYGQRPPVDRDAVVSLLKLVSDEFPASVTYNHVAGWDYDTLRLVEAWASAVHLAASDGDVKIPPMPEVLNLKVGDWAQHKHRELDPRQVAAVRPGEIRLHVGSLLTDWVPASNYTQVRG